MVTADPTLDAGPDDPARLAAEEPAATLNVEVKVVAEATLELYVVVWVTPTSAEIFSPSANTKVSLSVPVLLYLT